MLDHIFGHRHNRGSGWDGFFRDHGTVGTFHLESLPILVQPVSQRNCPGRMNLLTSPPRRRYRLPGLRPLLLLGSGFPLACSAVSVSAVRATFWPLTKEVGTKDVDMSESIVILAGKPSKRPRSSMGAMIVEGRRYINNRSKHDGTPPNRTSLQHAAWPYGRHLSTSRLQCSAPSTLRSIR